MASINVTSSEFEALITKGGTVFVDFWAEWCGPCKMFGPIYEKVSDQYPDISFAKVDTEAEREIAAAAGITSIPTLMAFRDGILLYREAGALPEQSLQMLVAQVTSLDMDEIRAEIAKESSEVSNS